MRKEEGKCFFLLGAPTQLVVIPIFHLVDDVNKRLNARRRDNRHVHVEFHIVDADAAQHQRLIPELREPRERKDPAVDGADGSAPLSLLGIPALPARPVFRMSTEPRRLFLGDLLVLLGLLGTDFPDLLVNHDLAAWIHDADPAALLPSP